jgi:hypothetical protein
MGGVSKRGLRVLELEDFRCRCGAGEFERTCREEVPVSLLCRSCGRSYTIRKLQKRNRLSGLPMSFGFRSLYWDRFDRSGGSLYGVAEEGWEIRED